MHTNSIRSLILSSGLLIAAQSYSTELGEIFDLPTDWELTPAESQECSMGARGSNSGAENSYSETASKFLTWITGTVELAEYEPIGEVANYFGFAALRTEIRDRTDSQGDVQFRGSIYQEILELLDDTQRDVLYGLMAQHKPLLTGFLEERVNLVHELWGLQNGDSIDFAKAEELMMLIGKYEGAITVTAAQAYAQLIPMLTEEQTQYLWDIREGRITSSDMRSSSLQYADEAEEQFSALDSFEQEIMQEVASKVISWVTGDLEDSIYLPPGKIGNFFGFANYRYVDRARVTRGGAAQLVDENLDQSQRDLMCALSWNVVGFTNDYIQGRADLISAVSALKENPSAEISMTELAEEYAEVAGIGEGRRAVLEAMTFNLIASTLSDDQITAFNELRVQSTSNPIESSNVGGGAGNGGGMAGSRAGSGSNGGGMGGNRVGSGGNR